MGLVAMASAPPCKAIVGGSGAAVAVWVSVLEDEGWVEDRIGPSSGDGVSPGLGAGHPLPSR